MENSFTLQISEDSADPEGLSETCLFKPLCDLQCSTKIKMTPDSCSSNTVIINPRASCAQDTN